MRHGVELTNVHDVVFVLEHGRLVVVRVEIVWRREDGNQRGERRRPTLAVHAVAVHGSISKTNGRKSFSLRTQYLVLRGLE